MPQNRSVPGQPPKRVLLFVTCLIDQFFPEVGESVVNVLERLGVEVMFPEDQTCCGQPAFNSGYTRDAEPVARRFLDVFEGDDPIVVPSGSCAAMVKNFYGELLHHDPKAQQRAAAVGQRLYEFSQFLVDVLGVPDLDAELDTTVTYHRSCHLLREMGVDRQPEQLLRSIRGLELRTMDKSEVCCGFGGTFAAKFSDISTGMMNEKLDNASKTGAQYLVACDVGCLMHLQGGIRRRGDQIQTLHIAQLLDRATAATGPREGARAG